MPPPGFEQVPEVPQHGQECGETFESLRALRVHQPRARRLDGDMHVERLSRAVCVRGVRQYLKRPWLCCITCAPFVYTR
eukprot:4606237-Pyramimonas_sp.AAC.1